MLFCQVKYLLDLLSIMITDYFEPLILKLEESIRAEFRYLDLLLLIFKYWVSQFKILNKSFSLLAIYRTFDSNINLFLDELENYYYALNSNKSCLLVGDVNINLFSDDLIANRYLNCLVGAGLVQCINKPTRIDGDSISLIDHIFVRYADQDQMKAAVLHTAITYWK